MKYKLANSENKLQLLADFLYYENKFNKDPNEKSIKSRRKANKLLSQLSDGTLSPHEKEFPDSNFWMSIQLKSVKNELDKKLMSRSFQKILDRWGDIFGEY